MITVIQTPAAGTQFTGVAGAGLVLFSTLALPPDNEDIVPIITNVALEVLGFAENFGFDCFLKRTSAPLATTERITIQRVDAGPPPPTTSGFSKAGCRIQVPRDFVITGGPPWQLVLITTGKTVLSSLVVSFQLGQAFVT